MSLRTKIKNIRNLAIAKFEKRVDFDFDFLLKEKLESNLINFSNSIVENLEFLEFLEGLFETQEKESIELAYMYLACDFHALRLIHYKNDKNLKEINYISLKFEIIKNKIRGELDVLFKRIHHFKRQRKYRFSRKRIL